MRIFDVMSRDVVSIKPDAEVAAAREALQRADIDHLVVLDGRKVVGIVSDKDLASAADVRKVSTAMTRGVVTIPPSATLRKAASVMLGRSIGCLPVVDDGRLVGIVTTSDLLSALAKGDIHPGSSPERATPLRKREVRKPRAAR